MAKKFNVDKARAAGFSDQEIERFVRDNDLEIKSSAKGFGTSVLKSGGRLIGDTVGSVANIFNPNMEKNTLMNMGRVSAGAVQKLMPGQQGLEQNADAMGKYLSERYGIGSALRGDFQQAGQDLRRTAYFDPVGAAGDVASLASGAGAAMKGVSAAGKASNLATGAKAASYLDDLGRYGSQLSRAGEMIDPMTYAGRAAGVPIKYAGRAADDIGSNLLRRSVKASPSQAVNFLDASGDVPLEDFLYQNRITGGASGMGQRQMASQMNPLQQQYNSMVRTDAPLSRQQYAMGLFDQAAELEKRSNTPQTRRIVENLLQEAEFQYNNPRPFTNTELTNTKTQAFSDSSKAALADPMTSSLSEQIGRGGQRTLEAYAPGSKQLGQQLRPYNELRDILGKQKELGRGSQLINAFKSPVGAAAIGAGVGSVVPGVGNLTGAAVGAGAAFLGNDPRVLGTAGTALRDVSRVGNTRAIREASKIVPEFSRVGRLSNRAISSDSQSQTPQQRQVTLPKSSQSTPYSNDTIQLFGNRKKRTGITI